MDIVFIRERVGKKDWVSLYLIKLKNCHLQKELGSLCQPKEIFY